MLVCASVAHLPIAPLRGDESDWGFAPVAQFGKDRLRGQSLHGACWSKGLVAAEHVPDRLGQFAPDLDGGDFAAAFAAMAGELASEHWLIAGLAQRRVRGLDERPAQVGRPVLTERAAPVALTRLVDLGAKAGVADELGRCWEPCDVAELGSQS